MYNPFGRQRYSPYLEFNMGDIGDQISGGQISCQLTSQNFLFRISLFFQALCPKLKKLWKSNFKNSEKLDGR